MFTAIKGIFKAVGRLIMSIPTCWYGAAIILAVIITAGTHYPVIVCAISGTAAAGFIVAKATINKTKLERNSLRDALIVYEHDRLMKLALAGQPVVPLIGTPVVPMLTPVAPVAPVAPAAPVALDPAVIAAITAAVSAGVQAGFTNSGVTPP